MQYKKDKDLLKLLNEVRIEYIFLSDKIVEEKISPKETGQRYITTVRSKS